MTALSTELLVIGGGATGLGIAWDACLRGLKVVLIEQGDLGQGTSGRYHGLLHSGGRYVVSDPQSAQDCARENRILRRLAPHTIEDTGGLFVSAPTDPADFADRWAAACRALGVAAEEFPVAQVLRREPLLNPRIQRAFAVQDASLDSFDLMHALAQAVRAGGGQVWLRHRVERIARRANRVTGAMIRSLRTGETQTIGAEVVVIAAGPWSKAVARMAGISLPVVLGRGTMVAMASRLVHSVVNRLKPPADGDILVPVGTVSVLGTTDVPVEDPDDHSIAPWEVDLLLAEGEILIPGLSSQRALRAWSGTRALYRPKAVRSGPTRALPRAHSVLDHEQLDGLAGLYSVIGGKLTTFRLMAQEAMDLVAGRLGVSAPCTTAQASLETENRELFSLPSRWKRHESAVQQQPLICECELVAREDLERALESPEVESLDDLRRDLRLGMGPCQAGFCAYRAAGIAHLLGRAPGSPDWLRSFLQERWRGMRPLAWGHGLRQADLTRRLYLELLGVDRSELNSE